MIQSTDLAYARVLKFLRMESGKIQYALAFDLQLPNQQCLSDYESGKKHFTEDFILKVCAYFDISTQRFYQLAAQWSRTESNKSEKKMIAESNAEQSYKLLQLQKKNMELILEKHKLECELYELKIKLQMFDD